MGLIDCDCSLASRPRSLLVPQRDWGPPDVGGAPPSTSLHLIPFTRPWDSSRTLRNRSQEPIQPHCSLSLGLRILPRWLLIPTTDQFEGVFELQKFNTRSARLCKCRMGRGDDSVDDRVMRRERGVVVLRIQRTTRRDASTLSFFDSMNDEESTVVLELRCSVCQ